MAQKRDKTDSSLKDARERRVDNVPGLPYVDRVAAAVGRAWASHRKEVNAAWSDMREGKFDSAKAMQMWARMIENSHDVLVEVVQGSASSQRPSWLVIPYDPDRPSQEERPPASFHDVVVEGPSEPDGELDYTKFIGVAKRAWDLYVNPPQRVGNRVEFWLNEAALQGLERDTDYISFILRRGQGAASPLAIIVLRVKGAVIHSV